VFANSTVLGVRRQADRGADAVSLLRLITLLRDHPKMLSRSYYVSLYDSTEFDQDRAARTFARYAGENAEAFTPEYFESDVEKLKTRTERLHHFADRKIAHRDARGLEYEQPRFNELTEAIHLLEELTIKYLALLKAESWGRLLPTFQYDWKKIFTTPWIVTSSDLQMEPSDES
jgi:hypothetical protein